MNPRTITLAGFARVTCPSGHDHGVVRFDAVYDPRRSPLTFDVSVTDDADAVYEWQLDRRLVEQAAVDGDRNDCAVVGLGDVTLKVRRTDPRAITLRLIIVRDGGERRFVHLLVDRAALRQFVLRTYEVVPAHRETDYINLDLIDQLVEEWK